jgi:hypothetical protein
MIARPSVDELMSGPLGGWLEAQAREREIARKSTNNRRFVVILVVGALAIFALILFRLELELVFWGSVIVGGLGLGWAEIPKRNAVKRVKIGINDAIADALGLEYSHDCEPGMEFELAKACGLVPSHDRASFEDHWSGTFGDIRFALHEAKLEERRGSGKNRRWVTVFRGIIMSVAFERRFHGTTLVVRDGMFRKFWGARKDTIEVKGSRLDFADMAHPDFEDVFDIYTSDQVEARYLIDPLYVERLIALESSYRGSDIGTVFHGGSLVVALKAGNMFESGHIDAQKDRERMEQTIEQFVRLSELAALLNERGELKGIQLSRSLKSS